MTTVTAYLADTAAPMLRARFPSNFMRRQAFGAVAELAYLAGWKHHDLGHEGAAQRYYQVGYQLACEADPPTTRLRKGPSWLSRRPTNPAPSSQPSKR